MITLNNLSVVLLIKNILKRNPYRRKKNLILVSSMASVSPVPYFSMYAATKSFLTSLGCSLYNEAKALDINVITVLPGLVKTDMSREVTQAGIVDYKKLLFYKLPMEKVIEGSLSKLGKKPIFVPGVGYKVFFFLYRALPVKLVLKIIMCLSSTAFSKYRSESEQIKSIQT